MCAGGVWGGHIVRGQVVQGNILSWGTTHPPTLAHSDPSTHVYAHGHTPSHNAEHCTNDFIISYALNLCVGV